jgi:glycosyltransferase involved in cell wall biosynthesis
VRRILVVSHAHPPSPGIAGLRWATMARYLREQGHEVTIVASNAWGTLPDDPELDVVRARDIQGQRHLRRALGRGELRTSQASVEERPPTALLTKVLVPDMHVMTWLAAPSLAIRRLLRRRSFDCLVTTSPPESSHLLGLVLGNRRPAWIADFRDGWMFEAHREPFPTAPQRWVDRWLERRVCEMAEVVVGATRPIALDFQQRLGIRAEWVTNGWDPSDADGARTTTGTSRDRSTLVYTGTLSGGWGRNPAALLEAMSLVRSEGGMSELRLVHAGRLTTEERLLIEESGVGDLVEHRGTLDRNAVGSLQRSAGALVLLTSRNTSEATGKLFEYLASGRPILALAEGNEAERIVRETHTGITVPPDDVEAIAVALRRMASGELERSYAPRDLERYIYPAPAVRMAELVEEAIGRRAARRRIS